jgi:hypothetical protein
MAVAEREIFCTASIRQGYGKYAPGIASLAGDARAVYVGIVKPRPVFGGPGTMPEYRPYGKSETA